MARIFADDDKYLLGPMTSIALPDNFDILSKEEPNKPKNRVKESKGTEESNGKSDRNQTEFFQSCSFW